MVGDRIFVTGGSGFVGGAVVDELLGRGYSINALVHSRELDSRGGRVQSVKGDLFDEKALERGMEGCRAVIHLVGIIREEPGRNITFDRIHYEGTISVVDAARRKGIRRYLHMSSLGARPDAVSEYHRSKFRGEEYVRASELDWTVFRPSLIHGPEGEFMQMEAKWARKKAAPYLFMPYFGGGLFGSQGAGRLQPVYVEDVARAFVDALEKPQTILKTYELGGAEQLTWPELHQISAQAITGKKRWTMPIPVWEATWLTRLVPSSWLPFNRDQIIMSQEDNVCDMGLFKADFGWEPRGFGQMVRGYGGKMGGYVS